LIAIRLGHVPVGAEERLLDGVRRRIAVGHHPHDQGEEHVLVDDDEVVEGGQVAFPCAIQQDHVSALNGIVGDRRRANVLHGRGCPPDGEWQAARV